MSERRQRRAGFTVGVQTENDGGVRLALLYRL